MQNNLIKVIKVRKCFFSSKNKILIQALDNCETTFSIVDEYGRALYSRLYKIQKNQLQWVKVPKSFVFLKNQIIDFSVVCNKFTCTQFPSWII